MRMSWKIYSRVSISFGPKNSEMSLCNMKIVLPNSEFQEVETVAEFTQKTR